MRDYAKVSPAFWMAGSGKALRGCPEAQIVGLYLVTCPSANMIGLYYLPKALLVHETGLTQEGASKGLARAAEVGFAFYDEASELVWVPNAAAYQIGDHLSGKDKRKDGVMRELSAFRKHSFSREFFSKYEVPFELERPAWLASPLEAPPKPLRSQEQDQDQDLPSGLHPVGDSSDPRDPDMSTGATTVGSGVPGVAVGSIGDLTQLGGSGLATAPMARAASGRLSEHVFRFELESWVAAYERAVAGARGGAGWSFPRKKVSALRSTIEKFCLGNDRKNIGDWVERDVAEFARAVVAAGEAAARQYDRCGPDGWQTWRNDSKRLNFAASGVRRTAPVQPVPESGFAWQVGDGDS